jgi:hypothetical protein
VATSYRYDAASNLVEVSSNGNTSIVAWRVANGLPADGTGIGADDANPALDGLPNLAKYAFGLDPRASVVGAYPAITLTTIGTEKHLLLTYQRVEPLPADLRMVVEVSSDGISWQSGDVATAAVGASVQGGLAVTSVRDLAPFMPGRRMRLNLQRKLSL